MRKDWSLYMDHQLTRHNQQKPKSPHRPKKALAALSIVSLLVVIPGCISASAPKTSSSLNGEAMYAPQPWAHGKPVNITARLGSIQSTLSAVQTASNSYFQYQQDRVDANNKRKARSLAYESHLYYQRLQDEEDRLRAIQEREAATPQRVIAKPPPINVGPIPEWDSTGWDLGVAVAGWVGMQDAQLRQIRD
jgi:hypothetical protein